MRTSRVLAVATAVVLASCASPANVLVTESAEVEQTPTSTSTSANSSTSTTEPMPTSTIEQATTDPATSDAGLFGYLLVESDLPGWDVGRPATTVAEETWTAVDCAAMDTAWAATGRPGVRARGSMDEVRFRQSATTFDTADEASAVLDAVDSVWIDCNPLTASLGEFWTEPYELPNSTHRTSGLLLGGQSAAGWLLAYWQIDTAIVILEVEGDDVWARAEPLLTAATIRIEKASAPIDQPIIDTTTTIAPETPVSVEPGTAPTTVSPTIPPASVPQAFPPTDDEWAEHRLAYLAPHPNTLGEGWEYQYGSVNEAEPADMDEAIPGCDAPIPPTLDGVEVEYRRDAELGGGDGYGELEFIFGDGDTDDAQVMITTIRGIAKCDLGSTGLGVNYILEEIDVLGADDAAVISSSWDELTDTAVAAIVVARIGGTLVGAFSSTEARMSQYDHAVETADLVAGILATL